MIKIELVDLDFYAYHGVYSEEKEKGNNFRVNLAVTGDFQEAVNSDTLEGTIDYEKLYAIIKTEMEQGSNLLEHVVGRIRNSIRDSFSEINSIEVSIEKLSPPIQGKLKSTRVTLSENY